MTVWHTDHFQAVTSPLTGTTTCVNLDPERFLIRSEETWDLDGLRVELDALRRAEPWNHWNRRSRILRDTVAPLLDAPRFDTLITTLDAVMAARDKWGVTATAVAKAEAYQAALPWKLANDKTRLAELLKALWRAGVLALPNQGIKEFLRTSWNLSLPWYDDICKVLDASGSTESVQRYVLAELGELLLRLSPPAAVGDLVPEVVNLVPQPRQSALLADALCAALRASHGEGAPKAKAYWPRSTYKSDVAFTWAVEQDPGLADWAALASQWLAEQTAGLPPKRDALRWCLQALLDDGDLPRDPADLFVYADDKCPVVPLDHLEQQRFNSVVDFFDWIIERRFSTVRPDGFRVLAPGVRNPLKRKTGQRRPDESLRTVMPPWLLDDLVTVLTADDWAWARTAVGSPELTNKGDWFYKHDSETGAGAWIWSPVRATCLYAKLTFPSRTGQMRHLDSGEADGAIALYDSAAPDGRQWRMAANTRRVPSTIPTTKLAVAARRHRDRTLRGAVQIAEGTQRNYPKLRFPTNKTADQNRDTWNRGYTAPWMPEQLAHALVSLRDWQIKHNPVTATTPWTDVQEFKAQKHEQNLRGMESTFLFRDPTNRRTPDQPITDGKIDGLYRALCQEVERRCAAAGITGPDGQPIRLIASYNLRGDSSGLVYPLHALRVSIVTHYIEHGGVSPDVMMKIVGHATVVMTLYYMKLSGEHIADMMEKGSKKIRDQARKSFIKDARAAELDALRQMAFGASEAAFATFRSAPPGSLVRMNVGTCPTGCTRCHEGGPLLQKMGAQQVYAPVQGLQSNCAGCRFLISGEPFLDGIVAEFNTRNFDLSLKKQHLDRLDEWLLPLDDDRRDCLQESRPFERHDEWQALMTEKQEIEKSQEQLHMEMANLLALSTQVSSLAAARMRSGESRMALVVGDIRSVEAALSETTEYDLVDRICRSADVFPSLAARGTSVVTAGQFRARAWDRLLKKQGLEPRFLDLDDDLARHIGNRLSQWLDMKIGRPNTLKLMEGAATIIDICATSGLLPEAFLHEMEVEIATLTPSRLSPGRPPLPLIADNTPPAAE